MSWRITLLGKASATREGTTISRFESSRTVALLARLVLFPRRTHPREELVEILWPEVDPEVGRTRLRHTLQTLRKPLEAGLPAGSVLIADRNSVRINPDAVTTDVHAFESAIRQKDFETARALYVGDLLPGLYDDWIAEERYRLEALAEAMPVAVVREAPVTATTAEGDGVRAIAHSLPPYLTTFFGRAAEKAAVGNLLARARLVTLTGLGGTGKTRLSVETLRGVAPRFRDAAFVNLVECRVASQIPGRIRDVLGLPAVDADPMEQICWRLADAPVLLVLDNLEQLVDSGGAELIEILLARLPELALLVTSRRALGISGERLFPLDSLPEDDALALFLDRAQATHPGFRLTEGNRGDIHAVCRGLEGIPLALELAAARIRAFTPSEMRRELQSRFDWLARTGLRGDKDDRHRSLAAALDWSWRLLPTAQQRFLANLSLFRAPFTAATAAAVTGYADAREHLESLAADSLVQSVEHEASGEMRHALLETVREFVEPRLEDAADARARFRSHYLAHPSPDENLATAWRYALEDDDGEHAHGFAFQYDMDWSGLLGVARTIEFARRTRALPCVHPRRRLHTANLLAECLLRESDRAGAMAAIASAVAEMEDAGTDDDELLAEALWLQATVGMYDAPHDVTMALLERGLSRTTDPERRADILRVQGRRILWTDDFEAAEPLFDEAERLYPPDSAGQRTLLNHRAHLAQRRGQYAEALRLYQRSVELARQAGDGALARNSQSNVPDILCGLGRWDESIAEARACLEVEEAHGDRHLMLCILWNLAFPFLGRGEPERAAKLMAASAGLWVKEVRPLTALDRDNVAELRAGLAKQLDAGTIDRLWAEGEALTFREALALARAPSLL